MALGTRHWQPRPDKNLMITSRMCSVRSRHQGNTNITFYFFIFFYFSFKCLCLRKVSMRELPFYFTDFTDRISFFFYFFFFLIRPTRAALTLALRTVQCKVSKVINKNEPSLGLTVAEVGSLRLGWPSRRNSQRTSHARRWARTTFLNPIFFSFLSTTATAVTQPTGRESLTHHHLIKYVRAVEQEQLAQLV